MDWTKVFDIERFPDVKGVSIVTADQGKGQGIYSEHLGGRVSWGEHVRKSCKVPKMGGVHKRRIEGPSFPPGRKGNGWIMWLKDGKVFYLGGGGGEGATPLIWSIDGTMENPRHVCHRSKGMKEAAKILSKKEFTSEMRLADNLIFIIKDTLSKNTPILDNQPTLHEYFPHHVGKLRRTLLPVKTFRNDVLPMDRYREGNSPPMIMRPSNGLSKETPSVEDIVPHERKKGGESNQEKLINELRRSRWMNTAKHKNHDLSIGTYSIEELEKLLLIFKVASKVDGKDRSHCQFKKEIGKVIGKAGADNKNWKSSGEIGTAAHRTYHQLFKNQKKMKNKENQSATIIQKNVRSLLVRRKMKDMNDRKKTSTGAWSNEENAQLIEMVLLEGEGRWEEKANRFNTYRSADMLRCKWYIILESITGGILK
tara:strand:+ start:1083 stop:2354 length:1272 start_codon:yes stop_codon:yes gene_type:complete